MVRSQRPAKGDGERFEARTRTEEQQRRQERRMKAKRERFDWVSGREPGTRAKREAAAFGGRFMGGGIEPEAHGRFKTQSWQS